MEIDWKTVGEVGSAAVALFLGLGGWLFGFLERRDRKAERAERERERREQYVFEALKWFEGKTQRRNIGIAVVEGLWHDVPNLRGVLVPLLTNQVVYLLSESGQDDAEHEKDNLDRLVKLLVTSRSSHASTFAPHYALVRSVIDEKLAGTLRKGLVVAPTELQAWKAALT